MEILCDWAGPIYYGGTSADEIAPAKKTQNMERKSEKRICRKIPEFLRTCLSPSLAAALL